MNKEEKVIICREKANKLFHRLWAQCDKLEELTGKEIKIPFEDLKWELVNPKN